MVLTLTLCASSPAEALAATFVAAAAFCAASCSALSARLAAATLLLSLAALAASLAFFFFAAAFSAAASSGSTLDIATPPWRAAARRVAEGGHFTSGPLGMGSRNESIGKRYVTTQ